MLIFIVQAVIRYGILNGIMVFLPMLYLDFVPADCYKFAFAASFGQDHLTEDEVNQTKGYITQYNRISVREESAKIS